MIRSSFNRALDRLQGDFHDINGVRISFSLIYSVIVTALSFLSRSDAVSSQWYFAPIFAFLIALLATLSTGYRVKPSRPVRLATRIIGLLLGIALVINAALIFTNLAQVKAITISLQPGIFGGLLLLLLNIFYLPTAALATLSYFAGTGFAVGAGTLVSPWWYHLGQIPALPLLGIIPTTRQPLALIGILVVVGAGALLAYWALQSGIQDLIQSYIFAVVAIALLSYLGSGSLLTAEMGAMGVSIWKFTLAFALELGIGAGLTTAILNKANK
jgi:hypothetical protein